MTTKEQLQQLRISAISRLKHLCVEIKIQRSVCNTKSDKLLELKKKRTQVDKLISKIDNAIRVEAFDKYDELYNLYKES